LKVLQKNLLKLLQNKCIENIAEKIYWNYCIKNLKLLQKKFVTIAEKVQGFLRRFRDPNRVPGIRENYHRVPTGPYRVPNIFLKKTLKSVLKTLQKNSLELLQKISIENAAENFIGIIAEKNQLCKPMNIASPHIRHKLCCDDQ